MHIFGLSIQYLLLSILIVLKTIKQQKWEKLISQLSMAEECILDFKWTIVFSKQLFGIISTVHLLISMHHTFLNVLLSGYVLQHSRQDCSPCSQLYHDRACKIDIAILIRQQTIAIFASKSKIDIWIYVQNAHWIHWILTSGGWWFIKQPLSIGFRPGPKAK